MKFNCGLANAPFDQLKPFVKQWFALAVDKVETKDIDITYSDFKHSFAKATVPLGLNVVDLAASKIDPSDLCPVASQYEGQAMRQLVSLCFELSKVNADEGKFFLSCHDAGPRLKVTPMQVWRLLNALREDGVIELLEKGNQYRDHRDIAGLLVMKARGEQDNGVCISLYHFTRRVAFPAKHPPTARATDHHSASTASVIATHTIIRQPNPRATVRPIEWGSGDVMRPRCPALQKVLRTVFECPHPTGNYQVIR